MPMPVGYPPGGAVGLYNLLEAAVAPYVLSAVPLNPLCLTLGSLVSGNRGISIPPMQNYADYWAARQLPANVRLEIGSTRLPLYYERNIDSKKKAIKFNFHVTSYSSSVTPVTGPPGSPVTVPSPLHSGLVSGETRYAQIGVPFVLDKAIWLDIAGRAEAIARSVSSGSTTDRIEGARAFMRLSEELGGMLSSAVSDLVNSISGYILKANTPSLSSDVVYMPAPWGLGDIFASSGAGAIYGIDRSQSAYALLRSHVIDASNFPMGPKASLEMLDMLATGYGTTIPNLSSRDPAGIGPNVWLAPPGIFWALRRDQEHRVVRTIEGAIQDVSESGNRTTIIRHGGHTILCVNDSSNLPEGTLIGIPGHWTVLKFDENEPVAVDTVKDRDAVPENANAYQVWSKLLVRFAFFIVAPQLCVRLTNVTA